MTRHHLGDRLGRLAGVLAHLKDRVRDAVAGEFGRVVGDAVRDLLHALVRGHSPPADWHESTDDECDEEEIATDEDAPLPQPGPTGTRWRTAVTLAGSVLHWWLARQVPTWLGLGLTAVAAALAAVDTPLARSAVRVLTAALDLFGGGPTLLTP